MADEFGIKWDRPTTPDYSMQDYSIKPDQFSVNRSQDLDNEWDAIQSQYAPPPQEQPQVPQADVESQIKWDREPEQGGLYGGLKRVAVGVPRAVVYAGETFLRALRGVQGGPQGLGDESKIDEMISGVQKWNEEFHPLSPEEREKSVISTPWTDINLGDIDDAMTSIGYSIANMVVGQAGRMAGAAVTPGPPVVKALGGIAAGFVAGTALTGSAMYDQFLDQARDEYLKQPQASEEGWDKLRAELKGDALMYGFWEAAPETAGNLIFAGIMRAGKAGFTKIGLDALKKKVAKSVAAKVVVATGIPVAKLASGLTEELATETLTQYKQGYLEYKNGMREEPPTWLDAFKEVAPSVTVMTPLMALGIKGADFAGKNIARKKVKESEKSQDLLSGDGEVTAKPGTRDWAKQLVNRIQGEIPPGGEPPAVPPTVPPGGSAAYGPGAMQPGEPKYTGPAGPAGPAPREFAPMGDQGPAAFGPAAQQPTPITERPMGPGAPAAFGPGAMPPARPEAETRGGFGPRAKTELTEGETTRKIMETGVPAYQGGAIVEPYTPEPTAAEKAAETEKTGRLAYQGGAIVEPAKDKVTEKDFNDYVSSLSDKEKGYIKDLIKDTGMKPNERLGLAKQEIVSRKAKEKLQYQKDLNLAQEKPGKEVTVHGLSGTIVTKKGEQKVSGVKVKHPVGNISVTGKDIETVFGPEGESSPIFVVDQYRDGKFVGPKAMVGFKTKEQAEVAHKTTWGKSFSAGRIVEMTPREFKAWGTKKDATRPASENPPISEKQWLEDPSIRPYGYVTRKYLPSAKGQYAQRLNRTIIAEYRQWLKNMGYVKPGPTQKLEVRGDKELTATRVDTRSAPIRYLERYLRTSGITVNTGPFVKTLEKFRVQEFVDKSDTREDRDLVKVNFTEDQKLAKWLAKLLGVDIAYFGPALRNFLGVSGLYDPASGTVTMAHDFDKPALFILIHEVIHVMKEEDPDTWNALSRYLWSVKNKAEFEMFSDFLNDARVGPDPKNPLQLPLPKNPFLIENKGQHTTWDEYMAEGIAHQVFKQEFWNQLQKKNPTLFGKFIGYLVKTLDKIRKLIKGTKTQNLGYFKDLENQTMEMITDAMVAFSKRKIRPKQVQAEETVVAAAIRYKKKIYTGVNHGDAYAKLSEDLGYEPDISKLDLDGFITSRGRFINRADAMMVAAMAEQIKDVDEERGYLVSEALQSQTDVNIVKEWLNDSVVKDVVYHFTGQDFKEFKEQYPYKRGFYFSPVPTDRGAVNADRVIPAYIKLTNPYITNDYVSGDIRTDGYGGTIAEGNVEEKGLQYQDLIDNGYDGVIGINPKTKEVWEYVVFDPKAIKSAITPPTTKAEAQSLQFQKDFTTEVGTGRVADTEGNPIVFFRGEIPVKEQLGPDGFIKKGLKRKDLVYPEIRVTRSRPAIYFSRSEDTAAWFASSMSYENAPRAYYIKANKIATVGDLVKLINELPFNKKAKQDMAELNKVAEKIPTNEYMNRVIKIWAAGDNYNALRKTASHLTLQEVALLKKNGYDAIEGPIDLPNGGREIAVFSNDQVELIKPQEKKLGVMPRRELMAQKDIDLTVKGEDIKPGKLKTDNEEINRALAVDQKYTLEDIKKWRLSKKWPKFVHTEQQYAEMAIQAYEANPKNKTWGDNHRKMLEENLGPDADIFNVILAITSPQNRINTNCVYAVKTYLWLLGFPETKIFRYPNSLIEKRLSPWLQGKFVENMGKSKDFKVQEWARALLGDPNATVNDMWMYRIFFGQKPDRTKESSMLVPEHAASRHMLIRVAKRLTAYGKAGGKWNSDQAQAALWAYIKSKIEGYPLSDQVDYETGMNTPSAVLGGKTPLEYLKTKYAKKDKDAYLDANLLKRGPLMEILGLKPIEMAPVSMLEKKRLENLEKDGVEIEEVSSDNDLKTFIDQQKKNKRRYFLTIPTFKELKSAVNSGAKVYMNKERDAGYVLHDGDLQKLFSNNDTPGVGSVMLMDAMARGARTLDCFDGHLPGFYSIYGWVETSRTPFDPEYPDFVKNHKPYWPKDLDLPVDVVFMKVDDEFYKEIQNASKATKTKIIRESIGRFKNNWERITSPVERDSISGGESPVVEDGITVRTGVDTKTRRSNQEKLKRFRLKLKSDGLIAQQEFTEELPLIQLTKENELSPSWYSELKNYINSDEFKKNVGKNGASAKKVKMLLTQALKSKAAPFKQDEWEWSRLATWLDTVDDSTKLKPEDIAGAYDEYALQFIEKWRMDGAGKEQLTDDDYEERFSEWLRETYQDSMWESESERYEIFTVPALEDIGEMSNWDSEDVSFERETIDKVFWDFTLDQLGYMVKQYHKGIEGWVEEGTEPAPDMVDVATLFKQNKDKVPTGRQWAEGLQTKISEEYKKVENGDLSHIGFVANVENIISEDYPYFHKFLSAWEQGEAPWMSLNKTEWEDLDYAGPSSDSGSDWFPHGGTAEDFKYSWLVENSEDMIHDAIQANLNDTDWVDIYGYDDYVRQEFEDSTGVTNTAETAETGVLMEHEPERLRDVERYETKWSAPNMNIPGGENYREVQIIVKAPGSIKFDNAKGAADRFKSVAHDFNWKTGDYREDFYHNLNSSSPGKSFSMPTYTFESIADILKEWSEQKKIEGLFDNKYLRFIDDGVRASMVDKMNKMLDKMVDQDKKVFDDYVELLESMGEVKRMDAYDPHPVWKRYLNSVGSIRRSFESAMNSLHDMLLDSIKNQVPAPKMGWVYPTHWGDDVDVLYWIRFDTRWADQPDGTKKKVLYIQEIQSDWIQKGSSKGFARDYKIQKAGNVKKVTYGQMKKRGYDNLAKSVFEMLSEPSKINRNKTSWNMTDEEVARHKELYEKYVESKKKHPGIITPKWITERLTDDEVLYIVERGGRVVSASPHKSISENHAKKFIVIGKDGNAIEETGGTAMEFNTPGDARIYIDSEMRPTPNAPLVEKYFVQAYRRMVRYAAESDHDMIAHTTGQQQKDRWDQMLSRVGYVVWNEETGLLQAYGRSGSLDGQFENVKPSDLSDYIEKSNADRLLKQKVDSDGNRRIDDLKIGGQFLKKFYDKIIPRNINKIFNKKSWGNAELRAWEHTISRTGQIMKSPPYYKVISKVSPVGDSKVTSAKHALNSANSYLLLEIGSTATLFLDAIKSKLTPLTIPLQVQNAESDLYGMQNEIMGVITRLLSTDILDRTFATISREMRDIENRLHIALLDNFADVQESKTGQKIDILDYTEAIAKKFDDFIDKARIYTDEFLKVKNEIDDGWNVPGVKEVEDLDMVPKMLEKNIPVYTPTVGNEAVNYALLNMETRPDVIMRNVEQNGQKVYTIDPASAIDEHSAVWAMPITKEMKRKALGQGFPLYANMDLKSEVPAVIQEKIGPSAKKSMFSKIRTALDDFRKNFITRNIDRLHPIKKWLGEGKAYMLARGVTGVQSIMEAYLVHGKIEFDESGAIITHEKENGFLKWYDNLGKDAEKFFYWLVAKRAQGLKKEDREFLFDDNDINEILKWVGEKPQHSKYNSWESINKEFREYNNNIIDLAHRAGILSKEFADYMKSNGYYIPFYRILMDEDSKVLFDQNKLRPKEIGARIRKLKGSDSPIGDPVENILRNWSHLINESVHNVSRSQTFEDARRLNLVAYKDEEGNDVPLVEQVNWADTVLFKKVGKGKGAPTFVSKIDGMPVLQFRKAGKNIYFKVNDPELFNAIGQMDVQVFDNMIAKFFTTGKRVLTFGATFGPAFRAKNFLRDTLHTFQITQEGFIPLISSIRGLIKVLKDDPDWIKFQASGMAFGGSYIREGDSDGLHKYVKEVIKKEGRGALSRIIATPGDALKWWNRFGEAFENAARVELYSTLKKKGKSHLEAAFRARDLMDFNMSGNGTAARVLISTVPFLNARIQGLYRMGRGAAENPKTFFAKSALIAMASLMLWWLNHDDDRYKELEDFEKFAWYHFWIGDMHFRIPKPFETGAFFSTSVEAAGDIITGNEEMSYAMDYLVDTFATTLEFNPTPQVVRPVIEQVANKSFFTGRPIEPMGMQYREPGERFDPWNSETLRLAGEAFNISPKRLEHLVRGYFSTFGMFILGMTDIVTRELVDFPERPTKRIDDYPFIGAFVRQAKDPRNVKYLGDFYDALDDARTVTAQISAYNKEGDFKKAQQYAKKNRETTRMTPRLNNTYKQLADISARMKHIWLQTNLTPDQKKAEIDRLTRQRNRLVKQVYDDTLRRK